MSQAQTTLVAQLRLVPLLTLILSASCASPAAPLKIAIDDGELSRAQVTRPALLVLVPFKRISLYERLNKVFATVSNYRTYSLDTVWDVTPACEAAFLQSNGPKGHFGIRPIAPSLSVEEVTRVRRASELAYHQAVHSNVAENYLRHELPKEQSSLAKEGCDYVFELTITDISVVHVGNAIGGGTSLRVSAVGRLLRPRDGAVLWLSWGSAHVSMDEVRTMSDLARGDLALLKKHFSTALERLFMTESPLFEGLGNGRDS